MSVIILHHSPDAVSCPEKQKCSVESNAGVLAEVEAVAEALDKLGIPWRIKTVRCLTDLRHAIETAPEPVVFNLVEELCGHPQDASLVPAVLRSMGKGFTGSDSSALMLSLDKWKTKAVLQSLGLPTPLAFYVPVGQRLKANLPRGRYIVKPVCTDASEGIDDSSVVSSSDSRFGRVIRRIHEDFCQPALVERFIDGREMNISVLQFDDGPRTLPIAEIDFSDFKRDMPRIINYAAKWDENSFVYNHTPRIIPAKLPAKTAAEISRLAVAAWHAVGCRSYARVDFRLDKQLRPWIIEVNTNPDLSPECGLAAAVDAAGMKYCEFIAMLYRHAQESVPAAQNGHVKKKLRKHAKGALIIERACANDRLSLLAMLDETSFFRPNELLIAAQVFDDANSRGPQGDYQSFIARIDGKLVGWVCYGETPCTLGTFDIYWLAVEPRCQRSGIGRKLMDFAEQGIRDMGGRIAIVETSGSQRYISTRAFYEKIGYHEAARVDDFYAPADPKIIYTKLL
ncbi:MAG TPA: GNAT family N-acetyltransferase [Sedimentisphaerales bacterium]|nr:GNAT family N-acetyltransferase [Sedimentisphaerales bacterium]